MSAELAERLLEELQREQGVRLPLDTVWRAYFAADPEFVHSPHKRDRLHGCLKTLAEASAIGLPATARSFDGGSPPLPSFVKLNRPASSGAAGASRSRRFPWCPPLAWAAGARLSPRQLDDLRAVHHFLVNGGADRPVVPSRERSLDLFGDEKRLDALARTALFAEGRLDFELLRCRPEHPPFIWQAVSEAPTMLVVENHHTYVSMARTLPAEAGIGVLAYGAGRAFVSSVGSAIDVKEARGGWRLERILYFGDVDEAGLRIPAEAGVRSRELGLPEVEPAVGLYELLFEVAALTSAGRVVAEDDLQRLVRWLGAGMEEQAAGVLRSGGRLAQEWVGFERLVGRGVEWWQRWLPDSDVHWS